MRLGFVSAVLPELTLEEVLAFVTHPERVAGEVRAFLEG